MSFNKNALYFLGHVVEDCISNGVKVKFELKKRVLRGSAGGYFWASHPAYELVVATKQDNWLWVLVHEWAHFKQCEADSPIWEKGIEALHLLNTFWMDKEKLADSVFDDLALFEADCDRIAIEAIKKFKLPIPIRKYIAESNINIAIYLYFKKHRGKGGVRGGACQDPNVLQATPKRGLYPEVDLEKTVLAIEKFNKNKKK